MLNDYIVCVGNPGGHWYGVVIDNITRSVIYYNSMATREAAVTRLCREYINMITQYRIYLRDTLNMLVDTSLTPDDYQIINGQSERQSNAYDCGVFTIMNIEKYITGRYQQHPVCQQLSKVFRCKIIFRFYQQALHLGLLE